MMTGSFPKPKEVQVPEGFPDIPPNKMARLSGAFYLAYMVIFASSTFIQSRAIGSGDAAAIVRHISASAWLFRVGCLSQLIACLCFLLTAWALYVLLRPVGRSLALLFLLLNLTGVAIESVTILLRYAALPLASGLGVFRSFRPDQLQALATAYLDVSGSSDRILTLFYGVWLFPLGYLVIKSRYIPRILGILLIADGISLLICFVQLWLFPGHAKLTYPLYPVMFVAEFGLGSWLLVRGVRLRSPASA